MSTIALCVLFVMFVSAACSDVMFNRAEQSSDMSASTTADKAIDGDSATRSQTEKQLNPWWRVYFSESAFVDAVEVSGRGKLADIVTSLSVYTGDVKTLCGSYTGYEMEDYYEVVQCGGKMRSYY